MKRAAGEHFGSGLSIAAGVRFERVAELSGAELRGGLRFPVGFVDDQQVDHFQQAPFDALQLVAGAGEHQCQEAIGHVHDERFRLADADRLDEHHVVAGRFADEHVLASLAGDAAQSACGRRGADVSGGFGGQIGHPRLVAEDAAAGDAAGRVDRQDGHAMPAADQVHAERLDERALARARRAADADANAIACKGHEPSQQLLGEQLMLGMARFDECQRPGDDRNVPFAHAGEILIK